MAEQTRKTLEQPQVAEPQAAEQQSQKPQAAKPQAGKPQAAKPQAGKPHKAPQNPLVRELRRKFVVWSMLAAALVIVGIVAFVDISYWVQTRQQFDARLDTLATYDGSFDALIASSQHSSGPRILDEFLPPKDPEDELLNEVESLVGQTAPTQTRPRKDVGFERIIIFGDLGSVIDANGLTAESPFQMRFFSAVYDEDGQQFTSVDVSRIASVSESDAYSAAQQVRESGRKRGYLGTMRYLVYNCNSSTTLYLFLDCTDELLSMRTLIIASIIIVLFALLLVFLLILAFSKRAVAPVAESYARQRRFITDASHDLKTPLAVIGSDVEVIEMLDGSSEWTDSIRHQVDRMTDLTNKLVMLSRMDEGNTEIHKSDFDLEALAGSVCLEFKPLAETCDKHIECRSETHLTAHADETLIDQALHLLVDNAIKYSSDEATITVCAGSRRGKSYISVSNPVDEIEPGKHDELFERFTRADSSRSSSTGGHGIGLAVVKAIAEAHGGSVHAQSEEAHSITFTLEF